MSQPASSIPTSGAEDPVFFNFEADFVESLRCIPMQVRFKLDTCGIKLKLQQWFQFTTDQRSQLVTLPCTTEPEIVAYRSFLQQLVLDATGAPASDLPAAEQPEWLNELEVPVSIVSKSQEFGLEFGQEAWRSLTPLQRFALIKLSRSSHENKNFLPALQEFRQETPRL
jgi:hypothetical protein